MFGTIVAIFSAGVFADGSDAYLPTVGAESGIKFRLFDYDNTVNNNIPGGGNWFYFRNNADDLPDYTDEYVDADGFSPNRAMVKPLLENGYPVFLGTRNGIRRCDDFSLGYLFGAGGQGVVEKPLVNTFLRVVDDHYIYNSRDNAVDYDEQQQRFFVRSYTERTSSTADFNNEGGPVYNDFLPFNHWDGTTIYRNENGEPYNFDSHNVNYWFGYSLEYEFLMPPEGKKKGTDMVFSFSGDDDVWVFIDDVLVLDLGGTHGMCSGTINFATGKVTAMLDFRGNHEYSYPTTIRTQFNNAGRGSSLTTKWAPSGETFADGTIHTLKMFYLERGGAVANCNLDFNLSTLPEVFTMPVQLWITDHADAGSNKVHLAFEPTFDHKMDVSELKSWIAKANSEKRIKIVTADSEEGLQTAEMKLVSLRDGHGEHDIDKGWVWVTVPGTLVNGELAAGKRYVKIRITEGGYEDENVVIGGMPTDFEPLSKQDGVTTFVFAEANTNISLKLKTPMRLEGALVVGGGGGGGHTLGGGGGGGGVKTLANAAIDFAAGTMGQIRVGAGGAATPAGIRDLPSQNGGDSRIHLGAYVLSALGGGGGGTHKDNDTSDTSPIHGHSGGNGGGGANGGRAGIGLDGGFDGAGTPDTIDYWRFGGGGGGAGGAANGINAGPGVINGITGADVMYGAGGAGCLLRNEDNATVPGTAYSNGGQATQTFGGMGQNGTGGGGAGGGINMGSGVEYPGGDGGCGIVVIKLRAL